MSPTHYFFLAQVNPRLPRTFGDGIIHISHIDYAVKVDTPLPTHGGKPPTEIEAKIGKNIAENLVDDGATLQMGKWEILGTFKIRIKTLKHFFIEPIILRHSCR